MIRRYTTRRLALRPLTLRDFSHWQRVQEDRELAVGWENDPHLYSRRRRTRANFNALVNRLHDFANFDERYTWYLQEQKSGLLIGQVTVEIMGRGNYQVGAMELDIVHSYQRKGFGLEAAKRLLKAGLTDLGLQRIEFYVLASDKAAQSFAARLGLRLECVRRRSKFVRGRWRDHHVFVKVKS